MKELIIGLLGGGAISQILTTIFSARSSSRQVNANALGSEVEALERTINLLRSNLETEFARHEKERQSLLSEIDQLRKRIRELDERIVRLSAENRELSKDKNLNIH